ncbi:MAG: DUF3054 domain-containing protein [Ilumatobacteraceae bacterium]
MFVAAALDAASVFVFVAIGRRNHDEDTAIDGVLRVAAPFLIALVIGWLVSRAWSRPMSIRTGAVIWVITVVVGIFLRNVAFDRGTATAFIVVATLFLGSVLLGWRAIAVRYAAKRP